MRWVRPDAYVLLSGLAPTYALVLSSPGPNLLLVVRASLRNRPELPVPQQVRWGLVQGTLPYAPSPPRTF